MSARTAIIDPIEDPRWLRLVESDARATPFHHPAWIGLLHTHYDYPCFAVCLEREDGALAAGLPIATVSSRLTGTRLVSLPFSDACGPLIDNGPAGDTRLGDAIAAEVRAQGLGLEIRAAVDGMASARRARRFVHHAVALAPDVSIVRDRFRPPIVRGVAKARRSGLRAERRTDREAIAQFYRLHVRTRRRQGVPVQPRRFVLRFAELFDRGLGFVQLVDDGSGPIAAAVFLTCNRTLTYKYGASDPAGLIKRPNNLLFDEAIRWGCENGFEVLDMGRTDLHNDGLRSFKRAWGARESDLIYTYVARSAPAAREGVTARAVERSIRRGPLWLTRVVGEVFYRHVG